MSKKASSEPTPHMSFARALKSFTGYLEGTGKAAHTIKNYRLDLLAFEAYLDAQKAVAGERALAELSHQELDRFHDYLKHQGLKTNTRRRKLLTVRRFMVFLVNRGKLPDELGKKVLTPNKVERIPVTVSSEELITAVRALPFETVLDERNRVLLWTLAETGCQVSEVAQLRFDDWKTARSAVAASAAGGAGAVSISGKGERELPVSKELLSAIESLRARVSGDWVFTGFNKFGSLGGAISSRGVELLVKHYAPILGHKDLTPRTFRHSAVIRWFKEGISRDEIQKRLGLKTAYAFRSYEPIFKGIEKALSPA